MRAKQNLEMIGMTPLSSIAMSAYTDLVRLLKDDALSGVEGKPTLKERGDKAYWYAARRVGTEMRFIYIGEDSDETRAHRPDRGAACDSQGPTGRAVAACPAPARRRHDAHRPGNRFHPVGNGCGRDLPVGRYHRRNQCISPL